LRSEKLLDLEIARISQIATIFLLFLLLPFCIFSLDYLIWFPLFWAIISALYGLIGFRIYFKFRSDITSKLESIFYVLTFLLILFLSVIFFLAFLGGLTYWPEIFEVLTPSTSATWRDLMHFGSSLVYLFFIFMAFFGFFVAGISIIRKNFRSGITRLYFLAFVSFSCAWFLFFVYNLISRLDEIQVKLLYLMIYLLIIVALIVMAHACRLLSVPNAYFFPKSIYFLLGFSFFITFLLLLTDITHTSIGLPNYFISYRIRDYSFFLAFFYVSSLLLPIGLSIYHLMHFPDWITQRRQNWLKKITLGMLLLIPYPLAEAVTGLQFVPILNEPITHYNSLPKSIFILVLSLFFIDLSMVIIVNSLPDVTKWFFDEIKFRASPELQKLDPNVNLADIYKQVDEWQKTSNLTPKEMTNQKVEEYVQRAKSLIGS